MKFDLLPILYDDGRKLPLEIEFDFVGQEEDGAKFLTPVKVKGSFVNIGGSIELGATAVCRLEYSCDRCCESFEDEFQCHIDEIFKKEDAKDLDSQNPDAIILEGTTVELDEIVLGNIIVNLPQKRLCNVDCKGLCASCGQNLNVSACKCDTRPTDPRFDILDKLL